MPLRGDLASPSHTSVLLLVLTDPSARAVHVKASVSAQVREHELLLSGPAALVMHMTRGGRPGEGLA